MPDRLPDPTPREGREGRILPLMRYSPVFVSAAAVVLAMAGSASAQPSELYVCQNGGDPRALDLGLTVCDAAPTDTLRTRMEPDNLQLRAGVLVTEVVENGLAGTAGFRPGDVIYRVGGVDVGNDDETATQMGLIGTDADTIVNFLRLGRPYRIKLRLE